jgi:hypothetical protein
VRRAPRNTPDCIRKNDLLSRVSNSRARGRSRTRVLESEALPELTSGRVFWYADTMKILIACEFSGIVREAFNAKGHDAYSVDLLNTETPGKHIVGDVTSLLSPIWDMMIAFPPCTYLCRSGARWYSGSDEQELALEFVSTLLCAPIKKIALENPVGAISSCIAKPQQIIQPWQFGDPETKTTCLWLNNLPKLIPTNIVTPNKKSAVHSAAPGPNRWRERSRTFQGIAEAMAEQWG